MTPEEFGKRIGGWAVFAFWPPREGTDYPEFGEKFPDLRLLKAFLQGARTVVDQSESDVDEVMDVAEGVAYRLVAEGLRHSQ